MCAKVGSPGLVKFSATDGARWTQAIGLPYDQTIEALAGQPGSGIFYAYCYGGDMYAPTDGGRAWALASRALRATAG